MNKNFYISASVILRNVIVKNQERKFLHFIKNSVIRLCVAKPFLLIYGTV